MTKTNRTWIDRPAERQDWKPVYRCDRGHEHRSYDAKERCENNPSARTRRGQ